MSAWDCSRAATFTASPVAPVSWWLPPPIWLIDHEPRLDAHPDTKVVDAHGLRDGLGVALDDVLDLEASEHRTFRVVLVRDRRAEERKDAIAGEVLHHAAKALDDLTELPNGTTDDLDDVFRVETRRQLC